MCYWHEKPENPKVRTKRSAARKRLLKSIKDKNAELTERVRAMQGSAAPKALPPIHRRIPLVENTNKPTSKTTVPASTNNAYKVRRFARSKRASNRLTTIPT